MSPTNVFISRFVIIFLLPSSLSSFIILFAPHPPLRSSSPLILLPVPPPFSRVFYTIYFLKSFVQNWFYSIFFVALTKKAFLCLHARSLVEYRAVRHLHRQQQQQQRRQLYYDRLISPWWSVTQRSASKCLFIIEHIYDLQSSQVLFIYVYEKGDNDESVVASRLFRKHNVRGIRPMDGNLFTNFADVLHCHPVSKFLRPPSFGEPHTTDRPTERTRHPLTPLRICGIFCESSRVLSFSDVVFMKSVSVRLFWHHGRRFE